MRRHRALQADGGIQCPACDGLGRVRAARRKRGAAQATPSEGDGAALRRKLQAPVQVISGCAYDWTREINSSSPEYYKWTQWFFLLLYKRGLAYRAMGSQWWCDLCRTILANEQVVNGCCWRHTDNPVTKKDLEQWFFKITAYADRLLDDLEGIDWPEPIKLMQRNWIGRSEGAELAFPVSGHPGKEVRFFTTRPDTVFGVSFMVLAPEHPLVARSRLRRSARRSRNTSRRRARQSESSGSRPSRKRPASSPAHTRAIVFSNKDIPIWIADYVLMGYGTGAIMAAPGEDERDFAFAKKVRPRDPGRDRARRRQQRARRIAPSPNAASRSTRASSTG